MDLFESLQKRRSIRSYTGAAVPADCLEKILQAGLLAASSRSIRPWELIVVRDKEMLRRLADCREGSARMLAGADCAVVVVADAEKSDVWVEDCAIVMANMHLMADSLGVGSCWIQGRLRTVGDKTTEDYVRELLHYPPQYRLAAMLSLGIPAVSPEGYDINSLPTEKIHYEQF